MKHKQREIKHKMKKLKINWSGVITQSLAIALAAAIVTPLVIMGVNKAKAVVKV